MSLPPYYDVLSLLYVTIVIALLFSSWFVLWPSYLRCKFPLLAMEDGRFADPHHSAESMPIVFTYSDNASVALITIY